MAITNFIPTVWSENLYEELHKQYIAVSNCNREFEGDIKHKGAVVKICGVGEVNVHEYTKDTDMEGAQTLSDTVAELTIDKARYFNFQIDDIDRAQSSPKLMNAAMKIAASSLANMADLAVYRLYEEAGNKVSESQATADNIIDLIIDARTKLYTKNVTDAHEVVAEVSPEIAALILKAKIKLSIDNGETLETGCIGSIGGCKIFVSNNIITSISTGTGIKTHMCIVRTKRAIAFAEQLSEIEAYRPEQRFSDAVKGLHLYGVKVVYPSEMVLLELGTPHVLQ